MKVTITIEDDAGKADAPVMVRCESDWTLADPVTPAVQMASAFMQFVDLAKEHTRYRGSQD
jgi:hypothetical protein